MKELKPCPFCASHDVRESKNVYINKENEVVTAISHIQCLNCGTDGPKLMYVLDVFKAWNERK